jgi:predicted anti-sigma-YlaC factor YlaD
VRGAPECRHETDILDLVAIGQWPTRASHELVAHAGRCPVCRDLASVAATLAASCDVVRHEIRLPDATVVWQRAQLRARQEALRQAARPIVAVQTAGLFVLLAAGVAWSGGLVDLVSTGFSGASSLIDAGREGWSWALGALPAPDAPRTWISSLPPAVVRTLLGGLACWAVVLPVVFFSTRTD